MWMAILMMLLMMPQLNPGGAGAAGQAAVPAVRTEKLTADEQKQLADAKAGVADAQAKLDRARAAGDKSAGDKAADKSAAESAQADLDQANRELQGTQDGISLAHHANTECGCYVQSQGREYDRVEFKDDTIVIRHVHEAPPSLH